MRDGRCGGRGAIVTCTIRLEAGQQLRVLCGGMSVQSPQGSSGGGGGTVVAVVGEDLPLVVAGGGGGTRCAGNVAVGCYVCYVHDVLYLKCLSYYVLYIVVFAVLMRLTMKTLCFI